MPTIAIVEGVKIQLFALEHPPPHFHAVFSEHRAQIDIRSLYACGDVMSDLPGGAASTRTDLNRIEITPMHATNLASDQLDELQG